MLRAAQRAFEHLTGAARDGVLRLALPAIGALVPKDGYDVQSGLAYGPSSRHRLDLYVPEGAGAAAPVLLFFYGGSWQSGSRQIYRAFGEAFASQGIVTAVADYRLYPEVRYPAFIADGALALKFLKETTAQGCGDPARLFVSGHSAGAYIAAMLAVDGRYLGAVGLDPSAIRGVIGIAGPYDFLPLYDPVLIDIFGGDREMATQPIKHVTEGVPPMLLAHGTKDTTVGAGNSRRFARRLSVMGNSVQLKEYPRIGHLGILMSLARGLRHRTTLHADMLAFIRAS